MKFSNEHAPDFSHTIIIYYVYLDCMHSLESHQWGGFNGHLQFMIIENLRFFFSYENLYFCTNVYIMACYHYVFFANYDKCCVFFCFVFSFSDAAQT